MAQHDHTYAVIMAGGVGSRFWPLSRSARPKQFLDILDRGRSLIQMTADRLAPRIPLERTHVTNARYRDDILAQLPGIPADQVLCEPFKGATARFWAMPRTVSRHATPRRPWCAPPTTSSRMRPASWTCWKWPWSRLPASNQLLTLGITPTRPDTGYGYIHLDLPGAADDRMRLVKTFTEKPRTLELADISRSSRPATLLECGIFVWSVQTILDRLEAQMPDLHALFEEHKADLGTEREPDAIGEHLRGRREHQHRLRHHGGGAQCGGGAR